MGEADPKVLGKWSAIPKKKEAWESLIWNSKPGPINEKSRQIPQ